MHDWVFPFLLSAATLWPLSHTNQPSPQRVVVKMRAGADASALPELLRSGAPPRPLYPAGRSTALAGVYVVEVRGAAADAVALLAKDPRVEYAQPDHVHEVHAVPNDPFYSRAGSWGQPYDDLWALKKLDLEPAWDRSRGEGVVVAVVDSGVDAGHPDLAANIHVNVAEDSGIVYPGADDDRNGFVDDVRGWDFVDGDNDPSDGHGHGTHVAGIVAAVGDNGVGIVGVAPRAHVMPLKAVDDGGRAFSSRLAAAIVYAADNGADVVVSASGCVARCPADPVVEHAVQHALSSGVLVVLSAGNRGEDVAFYSPQNMVDPKPVVVAATDQLDRRASFSNLGDLLDLAAPGGGTNVPPPTFQPVLNVLSLKSSTCGPAVCPPELLVTAEPGAPPEYLRRAGTSSAAAHVAGVAALVLAVEPGLGVDALRLRLFGNALDLGPPGRDPTTGWGRLTGAASVADSSPFILARLVRPAPGEVVSGPLRILGAAAARSFARHEVLVGAGPAPASWQTTGITLGDGGTAHGELAVWDTQAVADGPWTIRLIVFDGSGTLREVRRTVSVDNSRPRRTLVLEMTGESEGFGTVQVSPSRAFCEGAAGASRTCSYSFDLGATVTLTARPDRFSVLCRWEGACSGSGPCTVTMSEARNVRAVFRGPVVLTLIRSSTQRAIPGGMQVTPPGLPCDAEPCVFRYRPGTSVTIEAFEGPIHTSFSWYAGQPCGGMLCTIVLGDHLTMGGLFFGAPFPGDPPQAFASPDRTVSLGTPVVLEGVPVSSDPETRWEWQDLGGNVIAPYPETLVELPPLGLGEHIFQFVVTTPQDSAIAYVFIMVVDTPPRPACE
jgi:subtilisin family serine protease